jgi:DNA-binding CsgD family transcriptional regulator
MNQSFINQKERWFLLLTLLLIAVIVAVDLITDSSEGAVIWHVAIEGSAGALALAGVFYLLKQSIQLKRALRNECKLSAKLEQEAQEWRTQSKAYLSGLSTLIDAQLTIWGLSPAERDVAFLLLKGLSLKEIANLRETTEKTARVQSMAIYAKAGLAGRSELSAFFLEDLLPERAN